MTASSRMRTLWATDPVKYWRAAPHTSGRTARRSTWRPSRVRIDTLVSPAATTSAAWGSSAKARATAAGSSAAASRSMSWLAAFMRRGDPATSTRSTPATGEAVAQGVSATGRATARGMPSMRWAIRSRAQRRLASVRTPLGQAGHLAGGDRLGQLPRRGRPEPLVDQPGLGRAEARHADQSPAGRAGPRPEAPPAWPPGRCPGTRGPWRRSPCRPRGWRPARARTGWTGRRRSRRGPGPAVIGADPEAGLAGEHQQLGHLREQPGQLLVPPGHRRSSSSGGGVLGGQRQVGALDPAGRAGLAGGQGGPDHPQATITPR